MSEKPIIFSSEMVRAILDDRKTQTRRVIKPQPYIKNNMWTINPPRKKLIDAGTKYPCSELRTNSVEIVQKSLVPLARYQVGDKLWVRETLSLWPGTIAFYEADDEPIDMSVDGENYYQKQQWLDNYKNAKVPSIHMPKWAARIWLEVTNVRVERLQDISRWDIDSEGCPFRCESDEGLPEKQLDWFIKLWDSINGKKYPWKDNPWVWIYDFKRIK